MLSKDRSTFAPFAGVAELADARDLKSRATKVAYRFDPGHRHQLFKYRGVEQLVARQENYRLTQGPGYGIIYKHSDESVHIAG